MAEKVCDDCGNPLKYYEQNNRYYCHTCKKYAPKTLVDEDKTDEEEIEEEDNAISCFTYKCNIWSFLDFPLPLLISIEPIFKQRFGRVSEE